MMFSSNRDDWSTPIGLFSVLCQEFNFTVDVCADENNAKCLTFYDKNMDGLKQEWIGSCWCNPPYGRGVNKWIEKAYKSSLSGATVVCLVPARTDTKWFHDFVLGKAEIRFVKGRLHFDDGKGSSPFPSMILIYRPSRTL